MRRRVHQMALPLPLRSRGGQLVTQQLGNGGVPGLRVRLLFIQHSSWVLQASLSWPSAPSNCRRKYRPVAGACPIYTTHPAGAGEGTSTNVSHSGDLCDRSANPDLPDGRISLRGDLASYAPVPAADPVSDQAAVLLRRSSQAKWPASSGWTSLFGRMSPRFSANGAADAGSAGRGAGRTKLRDCG